jgi:hypothetical protein
MSCRVLLALGLALTASAADPQSIFDGRTTAGWIEITGKPFPTGCWRVEDGALRAFTGADGMQDIRTVETYRSFDFEFEWKIEAHGNSGVKYLIQKVDEWTPAGRGRQARARGLEYQLADDANEEALEHPNKAVASLYGGLAPSPRIHPAIGQYNRSRILVRGTHVEHWLNGTKVLEFDTTGPEALKILDTQRKNQAPAFPQGGPISLQNHNSPVWFRNLRVRRLD